MQYAKGKRRHTDNELHVAIVNGIISDDMHIMSDYYRYIYVFLLQLEADINVASNVAWIGTGF